MIHQKPRIVFLHGCWSVRQYWPQTAMTQAELVRLYKAEKWVYLENFKLLCDKVYSERRDDGRDLFNQPQEYM